MRYGQVRDYGRFRFMLLAPIFARDSWMIITLSWPGAAVQAGVITIVTCAFVAESSVVEEPT